MPKKIKKRKAPAKPKALKPAKKVDLVEIAKKKRQIYLLRKLQKGRALSVAEIKELEKLENKTLPPGVLRTREEVGKAFGVSARSVQYWLKDGMPKTPEGHYDLIMIQTWRNNKNKKPEKSNDLDKINWDIKYREYRARLSELDLKKANGLVIDREEVETGRVARIMAVKRSFLLLGRTVAPIIVGMEAREIQAHIDEKVKEIIKQFGR